MLSNSFGTSHNISCQIHSFVQIDYFSSKLRVVSWHEGQLNLLTPLVIHVRVVLAGVCSPNHASVILEVHIRHAFWVGEKSPKH